MKSLVFSTLLICLCIAKSNAQVVIKIEDISKHIGDSVKIYTKIYSGRYLSRFKDRPTYLDVGADYPGNPLTILIAEKDRENFEDRPEMMYAYKGVCITGKLELNNNKPQMVVTKPSQVVIQQ